MQVVNNLQVQDSARARKCSEAAGDESDKKKGKMVPDRGRGDNLNIWMLVKQERHFGGDLKCRWQMI